MQQFPNQPPSYPPPPFMFPQIPLIQMQTVTQQSPPNPPDDIEQKNIIDKLANFVARNGAEFENVTKEKQKDNPCFKFLFGGDFHAYYQFKLNLERELMRFQQTLPPNLVQNPPIFSQPPSFLLPPPNMPSDQSFAQITALQAKINLLKEQITQSQKNLAAQDEFFKAKKKIQLEELLNSKVNEKFYRLLNQSNVDLKELDQLTGKIIQVCTKDAIANGRNFVFEKNLTDKKIELICYYLTQKIINKESSNEARLHLIYFMNDLVHYGNKKRIELVKNNLEKVIIPCFCYAIEKTDDEKRGKMNKLLDIWEKNNYFSAEILEKLRDPSSGVKYHEDSLLAENRQQIKSLENELETQFKQLDQQHNEYVNHVTSQITVTQNQINQIIQHQQQSFLSIPPPIPPPVAQLNTSPLQQQNKQNNQSQNTPSKPQPLMSLMSINPFENTPNKQQLPTQIQSQSIQKPNQFCQPPPNFNIPPPQPLAPTPLMSIKHNVTVPHTTPTAPPTNLIIPPPLIVNISPTDSQKQATEFSATNMYDQKIPELDVPYYNLPAGLMVSLVKKEEVCYKPLNPKLLKLPPPQPPSERLLKALEEYYEPASESKPRNEYGWEKDSLYDFYKTKVEYRILKKQEIIEKRKKNRSLSISRSSSRSRSRSKSRSKKNTRSRSKNKKHKRKRSYSSSSSSRSRRSSSKSKTRSRSRNRYTSKSRTRSRSSSRSSSRSYSRSRSRSRTPPRQRINRKRTRSRSATPPNLMFTSAPVSSLDQRLDVSNRGHQMMQKMGWSGISGLGRQEQGIFNPIEGGEVRDRSEMYKGIGVKNDPFEAFRKNKSQGYIQRLRDRDEQRELARKSVGNLKDDKK